MTWCVDCEQRTEKVCGGLGLLLCFCSCDRPYLVKETEGEAETGF